MYREAASTETRYDRQDAVLSSDRRMGTALGMIGYCDDPWSARWGKLIAGSAGTGRIWSDFHGPARSACDHWILGPHREMVATINDDVDYDYLDKHHPIDDLRQMVSQSLYPALLLCGNRPARTCETLRALVQAQVRLPVITTAVGPGGFFAYRADCPEIALTDHEAVQGEPPLATGPGTEMSLAAQGAAVHEILTAPCQRAGAGIVAYYAAHDDSRISLPDQPNLAELYREVSRPLALASFAGASLVFLGAGALGNWTPLPIVLDGAVQADVWDMDVFAESNLARQPLGAGSVGQAKALVVAEQLQRISQGSSIRGFCREVHAPDDFGVLDERTIVLGLPDNDAARCAALEAAMRAGCLGGTAAVSPTHARIIVQQHACYECLGLAPDDVQQGNGSCAMAPQPSIVTMNALAAAILVAELRQALSGRKSRCLRYFGDVDHPPGNRFGKHLTAPACPHLKPRWLQSVNAECCLGGNHA
jgi:molybdopterin/thiamine biosynthesis adenylyltransferase